MDSKKKSEKLSKKPALTIVFESWSIPIVGLLMLIIGGFAGYNLRFQSDIQTAQSNIPIQTEQNSEQSLGGNKEELMAFVVSQARHFRGDPDAPVTLIEFGDFQ